MDGCGYDTDGYKICRGLLTPDYCATLVKAARCIAPADFQPLYMPHRQHATFLEAMRCHPVVSVVESIFGGEASGLGAEYFFMPPGTRGFTPHQDNVWVQAPPGDFIHAWLALTDIDKENGCLQFWPGSHKLGALPLRRINEDAGPGQNPTARDLQVDMDTAPVDIELQAGDIVFWDTFLVHGSNDNVSGRFRDSLLNSYLRKGARFNPGKRQKRTEIDLHVHAMAAQ